MKDSFTTPRGCWEAKDTADHLDAETAKKLEKAYPDANLIAEDTRRPMLIHGELRVLDVDLAGPAALCDLLDT